MTKIVMAFLFCFISTIANAQILEIDIPVKCAPLKLVVEFLLKEFGEKPSWAGEETKKDAYISLFRNPETGTWTVIKYADGVACIIGTGVNGSSI